MQQINGDFHREKTDKRKETIFFCFRVLVWVATLAALFALAANLRVVAAVPESLKDTNITIEPVQAEQTCHTHIASTTIGRLGYDLYSDGTATVTDETGRMLGLEAKPAEIVVPSSISYQGEIYKVTEIGCKCFAEGRYKAIRLPGSIQKIGLGAFYGTECERLTVPDSIKEIGKYAFCNLTTEGDFSYPSGAAEVPEGALYGICLEQNGVLILPETVEKLGYRAVYTQSPIRLLCAPKEVAPCAIRVPYEKIEIAGRRGFVLRDGMLLNKEETELFVCLKLLSADLHIPETVRRIVPFAFSNVDYQELWKGYGKKEQPFRIFLPEGLTRLEAGTFYSDIVLDNDWIDELWLPSTLEVIEEGAIGCRFDLEGVVDTLVFQSKEPPQIEKGNFGVRKVVVPDACEERYQSRLEGKLSYETLQVGGTARKEELPTDSKKPELPEGLGLSEKSGLRKEPKLPGELELPEKPKLPKESELSEAAGTVLQDHILYTLYADGTAEVTQVGADQERLLAPWKDSLAYNGEAEEHDPWYDWTGVALGDVMVPSFVEAEGKTYTVTAIGSWSFVGPFRYGAVCLPDTIKWIGEYAFFQCRIDSIALPDSITGMGRGILEEAKIRGEVVFPASMEYVPCRTFYKTNLLRLVIPDTVTRLERFAVMLDNTRYKVLDSDKRMEVVLSAQIQEAGECAFFADPDWYEVKLTEEGERATAGGACIEDGILFNEDKTELLFALEPIPGDYVIPKTVRRIHPYAFAAVSQKVDPAEGATGRIWVPEGVEVLEQGTFRNCFWLKSLSLPSTIKRIETGAWSCISPEQPGAGNGLRNLVIKAEQPPEIAGRQKTLRYINVPDGSIAAYKKALQGRIGYKRLY